MDLNQLKKLQSRLRQINRQKVEKLFEEEVLADEETITQKVKDRWDRGLRPSGEIIGTYKNAEYALFKNTINPLANGNVDLTVTRALRNGLTIFPRGKGNFDIFSTDNKAVNIADKYGIDVYGLTEKEEHTEMQLTAQSVNKRIKEFVGL